jgi:hypothetical protein
MPRFDVQACLHVCYSGRARSCYGSGTICNNSPIAIAKAEDLCNRPVWLAYIICRRFVRGRAEGRGFAKGQVVEKAHA